MTNEFLAKRLKAKGLPTEIEEDEVEEKKKSKFHRKAVNLTDGYGPLTKEERTHLLTFALANKYDLYEPQSDATLSACVNEYLDATRQEEAEEAMVEVRETQTPCETPSVEESAEEATATTE